MAQTSSEANDAPQKAVDAVMVECEKMPEGTPIVKGYDFNNGVNHKALLDQMKFSGFQASHFGDAVDRINEMISWRLSDEPITEDDEVKDPEERSQTRCTIFLGMTSSMISSGNREVIRYLVEHKMIDAIVTTCGAIEEDFMKCMRPHYMGKFNLKGAPLRKKGHNRIGNLIVPNDNYVEFEKFFTPILDAMYKEQKEDGVTWTPSKIIHRMGKELGEKKDVPFEESVWYWAYKNDVPVFCPAITDGSVGDMMFFHSYNNPGFVCDIVGDIRKVNDMALFAKKSGMIILGGGVVKHHICNANLMRNGADYAVFVNTAQEFDGSDAGARPDEAVSWGKITAECEPVKIYADATFVFPLLVAQTFALHKDKASKLVANSSS